MNRHALAVQQRLRDYYIPEITSIKHEGEYVEAPQPVPWFPDQLAWYMTVPKAVVRRFAPFASFQKFLVAETDVGNISRQEVVSMIPPLMMDIQAHHTVLDLCAAPGSKSAQLIEMVHAGEEEKTRTVAKTIATGTDQPESLGYADDGRSTGLLIANDVDYKRAHMLVHQVKRLSSPNIIVTNHDATLFPSIKLPTTTSSDGKRVDNLYLKFDRILADVPCSGDGTARKNVNVWKDWNPGNALGLYITQVRILVRALQMLKAGGRVVYSTCSLNPVENEAVLASAIDRCGGPAKVQLIPTDDALPGLRRKPGLRSWKVMDKQGRIWNNWADVESQRARTGEEGLGKLTEGMFTPKGDLADLPLDRAMRIYPHQQDTGGFFIAVLEKQSEFKARPEAESKKVQPKPPVTTIVDEIEAHKDDGKGLGEKIYALDEVAAPPAEVADQNVGAAARQNQTEVEDVDVTNPGKRKIDDEVDAEMNSKRVKVREDGMEAGPLSEGDRLVHYPPPLGAELDLTEHHHDSPAPRQVNSNPNRRRNGQPFEEPFKYLDPGHEELQKIEEYYHISPRFPTDRYMVRNATGSPVKTIYYTTMLAKEILQENEGKGMKFVHCGVKMFVKQDVQKADVCPWRIQTDGMPILEAWVGEERVVRLSKRNTLRKLLREMFPKVTGLGWEELGEIGERVRDIDMGCCVMRVEPSEEADGLSERVVLPLWRSLHSLNLMLPKEERKAMLLRLFNDDTPLINTTKLPKDHIDGQAVEAQESLLKPEAPVKKEEEEEEGDDVDEADGGVALNGFTVDGKEETELADLKDEMKEEVEEAAVADLETADAQMKETSAEGGAEEVDEVATPEGN